MDNKSIAEIYEDNERIREKLKETLGRLTDVQVSSLPEGEKWTVAQIVEHLASVEDGMTRICSKLLANAKAEGKKADGTVTVSNNFKEKGAEVTRIKMEAPERVHPSEGKTVAESLAKMDETRAKLNDLRPLFETYDANTYKFPHPFFGDISAGEWLILLGGHERRHLKQIRNLVDRIGQ